MPVISCSYSHGADTRGRKNKPAIVTNSIGLAMSLRVHLPISTHTIMSHFGTHVSYAWNAFGMTVANPLFDLVSPSPFRQQNWCLTFYSLRKHDREMVPPAALAAKLEVIFKRHGTARQKYRGRFLLARALAEFDGPEQDEEGERGEEAYGVGQSRSGGGVSSGVGLGDAIRGMVRSSTTRRADEWDTKPIAMPEGSGNPKSGVPDVGDASHANSSAEESYQLLRQRLARPSNLSTRVGSVEQACNDEKEGGEERLPPSGSHSDVVRQVAVLAERGRAHAALSALQTIDGRKKGLRVAVPYRVYASLFRALSNMYSERGKEEVELAAAPMESLQWLLRGMARQGHKPDSKLLNFGLEAFACAAKSRKVDKSQIVTQASLQLKACFGSSARRVAVTADTSDFSSSLKGFL